jgi:imidazole glycerol-phosphate synthase subunit HisH
MAVHSVISASAEDIHSADKIILPGVGHFARTMSHLEKTGLRKALDDAVLEKRTPVLGICLGMELMAETSEEGGAEGLGWLDAKAVRFAVADKARYKVPHMGWNGIKIKSPTRLTDGLAETDEFYFAHSYHLELADEKDLLSETEYESQFPSAIAKENIFGVQFHPEKSRDAGARLLKNFVEM